MYGLTQLAKAWYEKIHKVLINLDFKVCISSLCVYYKSIGNIKTIIFLYVDNILLLSNQEEKSFKIKEALSTKFSIKDLSKVKS